MPKSATNVDRHVGERIRMRRIELAFTQEKVGEALGVTFQQVQKYERGANRISAARLRAAANLLGVPLVYFYEGLPGASDPWTADPSVDETGGTSGVRRAAQTSSPLEARLLDAFRSVPDLAAREHVVWLVERMAMGVPAAAE